VKRAAIIAAVAVLGAVAFMAALVVAINMRGGLEPSRAGLKRVPLIGALVKVKPVAEPVDAELAGPVPGTATPGTDDLPYLRFGAQARLAELVEELEARKREYEALLLQQQRRAREIEAWERQVKVERDAVREKFEREKENLAALRQQLDQRQAALDAMQLKIEADEEKNLKTTAGIYDKMSPEQAAAILTEMYVGGQQESVVKIIYLMQDRSAAKTLEAFTDAKLSAQITEQLQRISKPAKVGG